METYSISQVSKMFNLPISTLRYYDSEGLFPEIERKNNVRIFKNHEIEQLRVIECLKKSGLEIKDIKRFMELCKKGPSTYVERLDLFKNQKQQVLKQIKELNDTLNMLNFKCFYYSTAIKDGSEESMQNMIRTHSLPEDIQKAYDSCHCNEEKSN